MKKERKNQFTKISSRLWVIVFCVLFALILKTGLWTLVQNRSLQYGPYSCGENLLQINVTEHRNSLKGVQWQEIHFIWNNREIRTTENYNFEGVENFHEFPWKNRCTPLITNENVEVKKLADCVRQKIDDGTIERERNEQNGLPLEICGIGYSNPEKRYE